MTVRWSPTNEWWCQNEWWMISVDLALNNGWCTMILTRRDGWCPMKSEWMMDDVGRSSVKSAASAVAPVAVPVALLLLLLFCPAALFRCHSVLLQCHQQLDEQEEPAKPASQQEEEKKRQSVIERFGLVWFCFAFPYFLVLISGILLPTARRSATGTFLFHVPLLLFLFYCCWLQCYNIVVGLVRELFFFLSLANTITALRNVRL